MEKKSRLEGISAVLSTSFTCRRQILLPNRSRSRGLAVSNCTGLRSSELSITL